MEENIEFEALDRCVQDRQEGPAVVASPGVVAAGYVHHQCLQALVHRAASSQPAGFPRTAHARAVEATAARATTTQARRTPSATSRSSSHSQLRARRGGEGLQTVQSPARKSEANELHLWCLPSSPVPWPMLSSPPRRLVSILYSYMLMSILYPSACARQTCSKALGPVLEASRLRRVKIV